MNSVRTFGFLLILTAGFLYKASCQPVNAKLFKTLTVTDGLPQSFISGLVQDSTGFIWVGTRDGLARYDGKKCKVFRYVPGDTTTLSNNTIISLYLDAQSRLWIVYETGDIDVLNTKTEALLRLTDNSVYKPLYGAIRLGHSIDEDGKGNTWLLSKTGDIFICNLSKQTIKLYTETALGLTHNKIIGISSHGGRIMLLTDTALITIDENRTVLQQINYTFGNPHLYNPKMPWKNVHPLFRKNGDIVMHDENRLIIYHLFSHSFSEYPLEKNLYNSSILQDEEGQIYFDNNKDIYTLSLTDELKIWQPKNESPAYGFKSMLLDKSGVLWLGTNGAGIQLYDLRLPRLPAIYYQTSFQEDILQNNLKVSQAEIKASFLYGMQPYRLRWMKAKDGKLWFSKAIENTVAQPQLCYFENGHLVQPPWYYTDTASTTHVSISAIGISRSGKLWGIDFFMRPVYFNMQTHGVSVYPPIAKISEDYIYTANSLVIDGENDFWISTSLDGLYFYNQQSGKTIHYTHSNLQGSLPTNQLLNMVQDAGDGNILWMGSLGGGLIRFDKAKGRCRFFTVRNGLPNNTVYAVVRDDNGILWCSSNKGIFSFDTKRDSVLQSFTAKDGLPGDEFNRYHYLQLPDGQLAFGGVDGYTVFNPLTIGIDSFEPSVALTDIAINNIPEEYGNPHSPFTGAVNSLKEIALPYNQNFLTFEFAALQYNITEKLRYRYMLEGFDDSWVNAGNNNIATYTKLPPGHYTLKINATNTAGKWSQYIKTLPVIIEPPFWETWWFITLAILLVAALMYVSIKKRIATVRQEEQQKAAFEREASELKAQAMRAQMNPHFIFNCLNSIKSLIHEDNKRQAISYLTTFSKLIRNQLNNAQQEVSLHDELATCRLYTELEALRFGDNIVCHFLVSEEIDTHSMKVPPLIIQPFIENAIWHGILPKAEGKVVVSLTQGEDNSVQCTIEDDGVGREVSMLNKAKKAGTYESKGMKLVKNRLNLYNTIHNHGGSIEVIDKKDNQQNATGTLVIIIFKKET